MGKQRLADRRHGVGLKCYFVLLVGLITVALFFSAPFIAFSINMGSSTTISMLSIDSCDGSDTPVLLWNYTTDSRVGTYVITRGIVYTSPLIAQNTLYFASDDGHVYALNATSGTEIWTTDNGFSQVDDAPKFPTVDNGRIFVGGYHEIYALDANSGSQIWASRVISGRTATVGAPIVIANDVLYIGFDYDGLRTLNANTGDVHWWFTDTCDMLFVSSSPLVDGDVVYVGGSNTVFALNAQSRSEIWNYSIGNPANSICPSISSFALDNGVLYFCAGDGAVYALDVNSGKNIWNTTYTLPGVPGVYIPSSPILRNGLIYVGSGTGDVCALNATDGTKLWDSTLGESMLSAPALYGGVLYFGSSDSNLYALNATSGIELWRYSLPGVGSPIVCEGVLYVGGVDGVYALRVSPPFPTLEASSATTMWSTFSILIT